jgi:hypothetical protein
LHKRLIVDAPSVAERLKALGLNESLLLEAAGIGLAAWASCTPHHPKSMPGYMAWGETVKALHDRLVRLKWTISEEGNLSIVINPAKTVAIAVSTGDSATGSIIKDPRTKSRKGPRTKSKVVTNYHQLSLWPTEIGAPVSLAAALAKSQSTWWFLLHRSMATETLHCELSRPVTVAPDGRIDGWDDRIVLSSIPFGENLATVTNEPHNNGPMGGDATVEVEVKRRANS